jgi:hypothetical protein
VIEVPLDMLEKEKKENFPGKQRVFVKPEVMRD